jgi:formate dehydrogenase subunit gamma
MEGAFEAMATGEVDLNWAKEHHDVWLARQLNPDQHGAPEGTPAE